ncbi:MAG: Ni/Fe hydrogenase subunit alpha [Gammaproteobacteria bacterium]|nr:MAG: Ni/Fe hydrogenase subunit alpha [Gammaproteobacteria bacterium]
MTDKREISLNVPVLARVEGEAALHLRVRAGRIEELQLRIFEPPRLFEKFIEGRDYTEVPDMVARICGICPVAYQMSAVQAIEGIFGVEPTSWIRDMRRVFYCGEWLQSHSLHIHLLALPDFLGFSGAVDMAAKYPAEVRRGLKLQGLGNDLIRLFGARSVHPVGARVGGFHRAPTVSGVEDLLATLCAALPEAEALVCWLASLKLPQVEQDFVCVALRHSQDYPLYEGRLASDRGLDAPIADFEMRFAEHQVPHSTALHCLHDGRPYLVGPLARLNLNADRLPPATRALLKETGLRLPSRNLYHSIIARALEMHCVIVEAIRLLENYSVPESPYAEVRPRAGIGYGATEAPRGLLWHRYELDGTGKVKVARIVPPTSQNQARIEEDLRTALEAQGLDQPEAKLRWVSETVIRNYDPCISCATHFLDLRVEHRE